MDARLGGFDSARHAVIAAVLFTLRKLRSQTSLRCQDVLKNRLRGPTSPAHPVEPSSCRTTLCAMNLTLNIVEPFRIVAFFHFVKLSRFDLYCPGRLPCSQVY